MIFASDENKVAKFTAVQHTGFVIIFKWKFDSRTWAKFGKIGINDCPFFLRHLFDPDKNCCEFIGVYSDTLGLRNIYKWGDEK